MVRAAVVTATLTGRKPHCKEKNAHLPQINLKYICTAHKKHGSILIRKRLSFSSSLLAIPPRDGFFITTQGKQGIYL
jgi:hypothetical protein